MCNYRKNNSFTPCGKGVNQDRCLYEIAGSPYKILIFSRSLYIKTTDIPLSLKNSHIRGHSQTVLKVSGIHDLSTLLYAVYV